MTSPVKFQDLLSPEQREALSRVRTTLLESREEVKLPLGHELSPLRRLTGVSTGVSTEGLDVSSEVSDYNVQADVTALQTSAAPRVDLRVLRTKTVLQLSLTRGKFDQRKVV